jgi:hypothetical protein
LNESGKIIGKIKKIFVIQNSLFCVIEKCLKKTIIFNDLDNLMNHINRFFVLVERTGEIEVVSIKKIIRKCISITIDSYEYATYCLDTDEHD